MTFTKEYFDLGGSVYFYEKVDKLPHTKENALVLHLAMTCRSWTFARMTAKEQENCINSFLWAYHHDGIKGNFNARWATMQAIYTAFLSALGYDDDPGDWRRDRELSA